jgi:hypothetical protein
MPKGVHDKAVEELAALMADKAQEETTRTQLQLLPMDVADSVRRVHAELASALAEPGDRWKTVIPAKQILSKFAGSVGSDVSRFKLAYLSKVAQGNLPTFADVVSIFNDFAAAPDIQKGSVSP